MKILLIGLLALGSFSAFANNTDAICKAAIVGDKSDTQEVCAKISKLNNGRYVLEVKTNLVAYDMVNESGERTSPQKDICELFNLKEVQPHGLEILGSVRMVKKAGILGGGSLISKEGQILAIDKMICKG